MKHLLRLFLANFAGFYLAWQILPGAIDVSGEIYRTLSFVSLALLGFHLVIKPVLNVFLLPINILTLGLFRWVSVVVAFYLITLLIPQFAINSFYFPGASLLGITLPGMMIGKLFSLIIVSIAVNFTVSLILWILE